jgi:hypothetical protein
MGSNVARGNKKRKNSMSEVTYRVLEVPMLGRNVAASRNPRLQSSVPAEYGEMLSREVAAGEWSVNPEDGEALSATGQSLQEHLEFTISTRPHWLVPEVLADEADEVWTSGNLTLQGKRLQQLEKFAGSRAAALVLLNEEAARYGVKPFTTQVGTKPGEERKGHADQGNLTSNPWSKDFRGDEASREARIASIFKQGTKLAAALARAAGTSIGRPLRK